MNASVMRTWSCVLFNLDGTILDAGSGSHDSAVFPGVIGLLDSLTQSEIPVALTTSRPESQTNAALEHFGLAKYFAVVSSGPDGEQNSAKTDIVGRALARLTDQGVDVTRAIMVGDRIDDIEGAAAHEVPAIIVEWGYGSPEEAKGALATVYSADQLREFLIG